MSILTKEKKRDPGKRSLKQTPTLHQLTLQQQTLQDSHFGKFPTLKS